MGHHIEQGNMLTRQGVIEVLRGWWRNVVLGRVDDLPARKDHLLCESAGENFRLGGGAVTEGLIDPPLLRFPTLVAEPRARDKPVDVAELAAPLTDPNLVYNQLVTGHDRPFYLAYQNSNPYYPPEEAT